MKTPTANPAVRYVARKAISAAFGPKGGKSAPQPSNKEPQDKITQALNSVHDIANQKNVL